MVNKEIIKERIFPESFEPSFQALAYWIGYMKQLYRHHPLKEGAIFGEAARLLNANIDKKEFLKCEITYKMLGMKRTGNQKLDLLISNEEKALFAIEIKRKDATKQSIEVDFKRLVKLKNFDKNIKCYLLLVSQSSRPTKYVNKIGERIYGEMKKNGVIIRVRRVWKSMYSFKSFDKANYVCLIEVLRKSQSKKL